MVGSGEPGGYGLGEPDPVEIGRTGGDADQRVWGRQVEDGVAVVVQ
jgi:hypothetical protein